MNLEPPAKGDIQRIPIVSAVLAVRNEVKHIEVALKSLIEQQTDGFELEILVVDGKSTDGTQDLVRQFIGNNPQVKLLINERKTAPFAFNFGIEQAAGDYVCILGAHTVYPKNYIAVCLEEL